jgi:adenylyl-sulfate kinase
MNSTLFPYGSTVTQAERSARKQHQPAVLWFTGLSGSGKSTLANRVEQLLCHEYRAHTYLLDGDNIRTGLNSDLGFSDHDRAENIRRIGEVSRLFVDAGLIVLTAFISPFRADRDAVRARLPEGAFFEIYVDCPLEVCEQRDPKGLYKRARQGQIAEFTGITSPYEPPLTPELTLPTATIDLDTCARQVTAALLARGILPTASPTP